MGVPWPLLLPRTSTTNVGNGLLHRGESGSRYSLHAVPSTAQHSTAQHSTAQHSTAQHSTAQHSTAQHSTAQHSSAQLTARQTARCARKGRRMHLPTHLQYSLLVMPKKASLYVSGSEATVSAITRLNAGAAPASFRLHF
jgi:hypothetical protein